MGGLNKGPLRTRRLVGWLFATALLSLPTAGLATPLLALKEAENCEGCHNGGRSQRPVLERRCTLDCQGCHIDPAGAGPRNQWGYYYSQAESNWGHFFEPQDPLKDTSRVDVHYDGRVIQRQADGDARTFPMSSEFSLRVRPFIEYLHLTYQAVFFGDVGDQLFRPQSGDDRRFRQKYSIMIDALPLNTYVRAYRGQPMYGLRRPNHTLWIRERLGLDQFAMTDAVEIGGTPNVPFLRGSLMQGDPYAAEEDKQKGWSFHGGLRGVTMAWHLNGSLWRTASLKHEVNMGAVGAGLKPKWFLLYGERNWRDVDAKKISLFSELATQPSRTHPSSVIDEYTVAFSGVKGVIAGYVHEELHDPTTDSMRRSVFMDLHPMPFVQIEIWRRFESGTRTLADTLAVLHLYFDF